MLAGQYPEVVLRYVVFVSQHERGVMLTSCVRLSRSFAMPSTFAGQAPTPNHEGMN